MPVHVRAENGAVAPWVLLPGDPDRATYIAEKYLENVNCYTEYRKMYGYTGTWNGVPVSVQTTGMGGPSAAIILEELCMLGVEGFIRIGTCGSISQDLPMGTLLTVTSAMDDGGLVGQLTGLEKFPPTADFDLLRALTDQAESEGAVTVNGTVASKDLFYDPRPEINRTMDRAGILALEMETAALYTIAAMKRKRAATLLVVSDLVPEKKRLSPDKILAGVDTLSLIALKTVYEFSNNNNLNSREH